MKNTMTKAEIQLSLCNCIMEMDNDELIEAFQIATGYTLGKDNGEDEWQCDESVAELIEDRESLSNWLTYLAGRHRYRHDGEEGS